MSNLDEWDFVIPPEGPEALVAELRRRGVVPGQRVHVTLTSHDDTSEQPVEERPWRPTFVGSFASGVGDLGERSEDILRDEFPG
jgi:hypothetical protein